MIKYNEIKIENQHESPQIIATQHESPQIFTEL